MKSFAVAILFLGCLVVSGSANSILLQTVAVPVHLEHQPTQPLPGLPDLIYDLNGLYLDFQGAVLSGDTDAASYDLQEILYTLDTLSFLVSDPSAKSYIASVVEAVASALDTLDSGKSDINDDFSVVQRMLGNGARSVDEIGLFFDTLPPNGMRVALNQFFMDLVGGELTKGGYEDIETDLTEPEGELPPEVGTVW